MHLRQFPRAVIQSALLAGVIFTVCAYTEVLGLRTPRKVSGDQYRRRCGCWRKLVGSAECWEC